MNKTEIEKATNDELEDYINKQTDKYNIRGITMFGKGRVGERITLELLANAFSDTNIKDTVDGVEKFLKKQDHQHSHETPLDNITDCS